MHVARYPVGLRSPGIRGGKRPRPLRLIQLVHGVTDHGFAQICQFIRSRPPEIKRSDDLLDFAIGYLQSRGHRLPGVIDLDSIPGFVAAMPSGEPAYVLAYVSNRDTCHHLYRNASRSVHMTEGHGKDTRHAIIDTNLPRWQRAELLSRLQG